MPIPDQHHDVGVQHFLDTCDTEKWQPHDQKENHKTNNLGCSVNHEVFKEFQPKASNVMAPATGNARYGSF